MSNLILRKEAVSKMKQDEVDLIFGFIRNFNKECNIIIPTPIIHLFAAYYLFFDEITIVIDCQYIYKLSKRRYYLTQETIEKLNCDQSLLATLKNDVFHSKNVSLKFENNEILIQHDQSDNKSYRVLKMVQKVIGLIFSEAELSRLVDDLVSIDHSRKELMANPSATFSNLLSETEKGTMFIRHSLKSKSRKQWFSLKNDRLYWRNKENKSNHLNRSMEMKYIIKLRPGKTTRTFKSKKMKKISEDCCFSVIGTRKTLDLECKSRRMRDEWFIYIEFIHRHYVPTKLPVYNILDLADWELEFDMLFDFID